VTFIRIDIFARNVQQLQGYDVLVTRTKAWNTFQGIVS
jgi:hypothetical protein